jgi:glutathione S-transferase
LEALIGRPVRIFQALVHKIRTNYSFKNILIASYSGAPFGQLPILEIDGGVKIAQSCAIARYLARQYG